MTGSRPWRWLTCLALAVAIGACELVAGIEDFRYVAPAPEAAAPEGAVDAPVDAGASAQGCPSGRGPRMVRVGDLCIDATEVTEEQYAVFLATAPEPRAQPAFCAWNTSFRPTEGNGVPPQCFPGAPQHPVTCVDFCDARAFCEWAGKTLCGAPAGGPAPPEASGDPAKSAWYAACAGPDAGAATDAGPYPYGPFYEPGRCGERAPAGTGTITVAGGLLSCEGSLDGLFDMSGNVWEWENACGAGDAAAGPGAEPCRIRGGSFTDDAPKLACGASDLQPRNFQQYNVGFRCCAPAR